MRWVDMHVRFWLFNTNLALIVSEKLGAHYTSHVWAAEVRLFFKSDFADSAMSLLRSWYRWVSTFLRLWEFNPYLKSCETNCFPLIDATFKGTPNRGKHVAKSSKNCSNETFCAWICLNLPDTGAIRVTISPWSGLYGQSRCTCS